MAKTIVHPIEVPINPFNLRRGRMYIGMPTSSSMEAGKSVLNEAQDKRPRTIVSAISPRQRPQNGAPIDDEDADEGHENSGNDSDPDWRLYEIEECIAYTRERLAQRPQRALTDFKNFLTRSGDRPSRACQILRKAALAGVAHLAHATDQVEVYTVGRPPAVTGIGIGEHWWLGLTPAQVRAGPFADDHHVRRAESDLRRKEKRQRESSKKKNGHLNSELRKLEEGVRRQKHGLQMYGAGDEMNVVATEEVEMV